MNQLLTARHAPRMGALAINTTEGRQNLGQLALGVAFGGASIYAISQTRKSKGMNQLAWGGMGAGLLIGSLLNIYDGLIG